MSTDFGSARTETEPAALAARIPLVWRRILLFGDRGTGKSTLAATIARDVAARGFTIGCISADPGSPAFGLPGAVSLASWRDGGWQVEAMEPLCTLDAGRFRLPLVQAVARLLRVVSSDGLLIDAPGIVRGVAGAELLTSLAEVLQGDAVVVLKRSAMDAPMHATLGMLGCPWYGLTASPDATRPDALARARARTQPWNAHLSASCTRRLTLGSVEVTGTPPPISDTRAWVGRQVALYARGSLIAFGEVIGCAPDALEVRTDRVSGDADTLLVRDAWRRSDGLIVTAPGATPSPSTSVVAPRVARGALTLRAGDFVTTLVNGVFGDPLVVARARESRRVVLLDLGEATSLSRRVMHRVTDVFVTHAHFDHVAGLAWLLRARMGTVVPPCRIYGPPGMHAHVSGMIATVRWDRIGDAGPEFVVGDVHSDRIDWVHLKAGGEPRHAGSEPVRDGVLLAEPHLRVSAVELDHGIPVLAFCVESTPSFRIHKSELEATGIAPGPWLRELKRHLLHGDVRAAVMLPDGRVATVAELANDLVKEAPATRIVYATDFADTAHNRRTLERLAANADALICEATFLEEDARQACRTHHLTARACGEIAAAARVRRLVPFHFSKRYEGRAEAVYAEVRAACRNVPIHTFAPDR